MAWENFYEPRDNLNIRFLIFHGERGTGKYAPTEDNILD